MSPEAIEQEFKRRVGEGVRLVAEGPGRYRVFTPFTLDDGDHLAIVLRHEGDQWILSDEGHTLLSRATRGDPANTTLSAFSVEDHDGELRLAIVDQRFGDGLFSFVQALLKISTATQ